MAREALEHVVEERHAGRDFAASRAVEIERDRDLRFRASCARSRRRRRVSGVSRAAPTLTTARLFPLSCAARSLPSAFDSATRPDFSSSRVSPRRRDFPRLRQARSSTARACPSKPSIRASRATAGPSARDRARRGLDYTGSLEEIVRAQGRGETAPIRPWAARDSVRRGNRRAAPELIAPTKHRARRAHPREPSPRDSSLELQMLGRDLDWRARRLPPDP